MVRVDCRPTFERLRAAGRLCRLETPPPQVRNPRALRALEAAACPCLVGPRASLVNLQSIPSRPAAMSARFARLNGLLPKKPLAADCGEGCGDSMSHHIRCLQGVWSTGTSN